MKRTQKTTQIFTLRNEAGQFVGTYRALTSDQAIAKFWNDQAVQSSTFRQMAIKRFAITASVETLSW
jgi:hypothetical protein